MLGVGEVLELASPVDDVAIWELEPLCDTCTRLFDEGGDVTTGNVALHPDEPPSPLPVDGGDALFFGDGGDASKRKA